MDPYNFWQDAFDTFQSAPDGIKALALILPFAFTLGLIAVVLHHWRALRRMERHVEAERLADWTRLSEAALADLRLHDGGDTLEARDRLARHFAARLPEKRALIGRQ